MWRNSLETWGAVTRFLHWTILALIIVQIPLGWVADLWHQSPTKLDLFIWHKSTGILLLLLAVMRIGWRLANPSPRTPSGVPGWERAAAATVHVCLYLLIVAIPVSGWVINSAANIPLSVFWLFPLPDITAPSKPLADIAARVHFTLYALLMIVLILHVGAALRHHYIHRNQVLVRMMPGHRP